MEAGGGGGGGGEVEEGDFLETLAFDRTLTPAFGRTLTLTRAGEGDERNDEDAGVSAAPPNARRRTDILRISLPITPAGVRSAAAFPCAPRPPRKLARARNSRPGEMALPELAAFLGLAFLGLPFAELPFAELPFLGLALVPAFVFFAARTGRISLFFSPGSRGTTSGFRFARRSCSWRGDRPAHAALLAPPWMRPPTL